jgi:hypothetical protein
MSKLYCVQYKGLLGFIKPYNALRDDETYSLTYITPSMLDGIAKGYSLKSKIARHKLTFYGMTECDFIKGQPYEKYSDGKPFRNQSQPQKRHSLKNVTLILGFDNKEDAERMIMPTIYCGQSEYLLSPRRFDDNTQILEIDDCDFDKLQGVETFECDENDEDALFCGFNRQRDGERMYIKINRVDWK